MKRARHHCVRCERVAEWLACGWDQYTLRLGMALPTPFVGGVAIEGDSKGHQWIVAGLAQTPKLRRLLAFLKARCTPFVTPARHVRCCRLHWYLQLLAAIAMESPLFDSFALQRAWRGLGEFAFVQEEDSIEELPFPALIEEGIKFE